jgi:hypothetical protein
MSYTAASAAARLAERAMEAARHQNLLPPKPVDIPSSNGNPDTMHLGGPKGKAALPMVIPKVVNPTEKEFLSEACSEMKGSGKVPTKMEDLKDKGMASEVRDQAEHELKILNHDREHYAKKRLKAKTAGDDATAKIFDAQLGALRKRESTLTAFSKAAEKKSMGKMDRVSESHGMKMLMGPGMLVAMVGPMIYSLFQGSNNSQP